MSTRLQTGGHSSKCIFEMTMCFEQVRAFETFNEVKFNVFGLDKGHHYPLRFSSFELEFVMDLVPLNDTDIYQ